jgi:thioredoxin 1
MCSSKQYLCETDAPTRAEVDASQGLVILEFGTAWCGYCREAEPALAEVLSKNPHWHHVKIEDGPGRALGRSFSVKLWPTVVVMRDGHEVARLVRPTQASTIAAAVNE